MVKLAGEQFQIKSDARAAERLRAYPPSCCWPVLRSPSAWCRLARPRAHGRRELRHRHAWRAGAPGRFHPHMPYANPDAPKGGRLVWGMLGTFDSLNPLIVRGVAVAANPGLFGGREPDGARQ